MSHSLLPIAPPLPQHDNKIAIKSICLKKIEIDECLWATENRELQRACFLARLCATQPPRKCEMLNIASILQEGPTCGLTALSMILDGRPDPQQLLAIAKALRYTNNGEMFSAHYLYQLINLQLSATANGNECIEVHVHQGLLNCAKVKDCLQADLTLSSTKDNGCLLSFVQRS